MSHKTKPTSHLQNHAWWWSGLLSLLIHLLAVIGGSFFKPKNHLSIKNNSITVKLSQPKTKSEPETKRTILDKPLLETIEKPKETMYDGWTDHKAIKPNEKDWAPSKKTSIAKNLKKQKAQKAPLLTIMPSEQGETLRSYQDIMHLSDSLLESQSEQSFQELDQEGTMDGNGPIDLDTKQYRYISYFSKIRQAIEMAWAYPSAAIREGFQGKVLVEFVIEKDGHTSKVQTKDSSGHPVLDRAITEAISQASPFPPFPEDLKKERLEIMGNFHYILH